MPCVKVDQGLMNYGAWVKSGSHHFCKESFIGAVAPICLPVTCGAFHSTMVQLSSYNGDCISPLGLPRQIPQTEELNRRNVFSHSSGG